MKTTALMPQQPSTGGQTFAAANTQTQPVAASPTPIATSPRYSIRHILLGHPAAVRQTIYLLHSLHYAETGLWTPVLTIETPLVIAPAPDESISLLRRSL
ncbi:MAG: hypothetical protein WBD47_00525 [Phormidesmis sp.]